LFPRIAIVGAIAMADAFLFGQHGGGLARDRALA